MTTETTAVAATAPSMSERFMLKVVQDFGSGVGVVALTQFQQRLAQNYFMALDEALKKAEDGRLKKSEKYRDQTPVSWSNVNMEKLSRDVVALARVGLDPMEKNHVSPVLYKNNTTGKYDVGFIPGYRGIELKARKYGQDVPDNVVVELVCANDTFRAIKKNRTNKVEDYDFEVGNPFDRGEIVGGFYYHEYVNNMGKNKLVTFSLKELEKRKPKYASPEFWGGEKDVWENGKKTGKEHVEGWREKMFFKTIYRAAYSNITIDSQKIDDDFRRLSAAEQSAGSAAFDAEYRELANSEPLTIEAGPENDPLPGETIDQESGEVVGAEGGPGEPAEHSLEWAVE